MTYIIIAIRIQHHQQPCNPPQNLSSGRTLIWRCRDVICFSVLWGLYNSCILILEFAQYIDAVGTLSAWDDQFLAFIGERHHN
jgi:hypothetical protein